MHQVELLSRKYLKFRKKNSLKSDRYFMNISSYFYTRKTHISRWYNYRILRSSINLKLSVLVPDALVYATALSEAYFSLTFM